VIEPEPFYFDTQCQCCPNRARVRAELSPQIYPKKTGIALGKIAA